MKLDSFQLKCIAILTMFIDHMGAVFFPGELMFRYIGRIAFPIFAFLLVEGYFHTRDVRRYMLRLGLFAVISEIPYDLAFRETILEFEHQNVFFTLFIGVAMMYALEKSPQWQAKAAEVLLAMWAASLLCSDYRYKGILLIAVYYFLRGRKREEFVLGAGWNFLWNWEIQGYGALASVPIAMYSGQRGRSMKYFFYLFYPLHLAVFYGVARMGLM
ncbi:MAG: hypothetical protein HFG99_11175 [Dorea sp.]|jgi:hypothetical protein|nr:hypothetical protein [Dorea sp.]MCI9249678.1 hypothetical protein [Dorea sp.]